MPPRKLKSGRLTLRSLIFGHGDVTQGTFDPEGAIQVAGSTLLKPALSVTRRIAQTLITRAIRGGFKRFAKTTARPGIGSKVTKGPLMLGKKKLMGGGGVGVGKAASIAAAAGVGAVASHRQLFKSAPKSAPSPRPAPSPAPSSAPKTEQRKCCPLGTKRMVCFKRGRVKPRKKAKPKKAKRAKPKKARKRRRRK